MGRKRKVDKHLPIRVVRRGPSFYYLQPVRGEDGRIVNKWIRLGTSEAEMWRAYQSIELMGAPTETMGDVIDRYVREVLPDRPAATQRDYLLCIKRLRAVFGRTVPADVRPAHCYQYQAERAKKAPVRANRELAVLTSIFRFAIRLGLVDRNPLHEVTKLPERPRERLPEAWEIAEFLRGAPAMLRAYVPIKILVGLRQGDMLRLRRDQLTEAGILVRAGKTGKRKVIEWSPELRQAVDVALADQVVTSVYVFATRTHRGGSKPGQPYTSDGFRSIWHRHMARVMKRGVLQERFTEHDLRAHTATEAERLEDVKRAQELLDHSEARTTGRYLRGKEVKKVRPLR